MSKKVTKKAIEKNFKLKITPSVPTKIRHKIEGLLVSEGYYLIGAGEHTDETSCDISFFEIME